MTRVLGLEVLGQRALGAPRVDRVREALAGTPAWLVGGAVRDIALGRETNDLDLAVTGSPEVPARAIAKALDGIAFELSEEFPAWRAKDRDDAWQVDVAELRAPDIERDLELRDFTVGAVAVSLENGEAIAFEASGSSWSPPPGFEDLSLTGGSIVSPDPNKFTLQDADHAVTEFTPLAAADGSGVLITQGVPSRRVMFSS